MRRRHRLVTAALLAVAAPAPALAGDTSLPAVADVSVMRRDPAGNHGAAPVLPVKDAVAGPWGDFDRNACLRFDLSTLDRASRQSAELVLTVAPAVGVPVDGAQHLTVRGVPEDTAATWTELQVTRLTAPADDPSSGDRRLPPAVPLAGFVLEGAGVPGEEVRIGGPDLADVPRTAASPAPTPVVVRDSEDADHDGTWHAFVASGADVPDAPRLEVVPASDSSCEGDVHGDGDVDVDDPLEVLAWWGPCGLGPADLDGHGVVDFDDLLTVLALFGGACLRPRRGPPRPARPRASRRPRPPRCGARRAGSTRGSPRRFPGGRRRWRPRARR